MMRSLEKKLKTDIPWAGALHDDHTQIRHVHILAAIPRRIQKYELEALIREATKISREQRRELDYKKDRSKKRERFIVSKTYHSGFIGIRQYLTAERHAQKNPIIRGARTSQTHKSCTCPTCHFPQSHDSHGVHECVSCGRILHKKRELSRERKGRVWDRSL